MSPHRHSIFCILPPHILEQIAVNAPEAGQRQRALNTLSIAGTLRTQRLGLSLLAPPPAARARRRHWSLQDVRKQRTIYTAKGSQSLPGMVIRREGQGRTGDKATDEAYEGLGATHDFYWRELERNSIDDEGMPLEATVHFGRSFDNAFWNGEQMVFGDGDGQLFQRFTRSLDVIGHELSHGVVEDEAKLAYLNQAGALNESMADVFGTLVKQYKRKQTVAQADWLIGAELLTSKVKGDGLRSMKAPGTAYDDPVLGKDPQPSHMRDFVRTLQDNGGVHINSGIPNRAFYLVAKALGGHAWERAGKVWYETLRDSRLKPNANFAAFARICTNTAGRLYGVGKEVEKVVRAAWTEVGVLTG